MRRNLIEPTQELKHDLKKRNEALVFSGGTLDTEGLEVDVQNLLRHTECGTVEVRQWITEVSYDAFLMSRRKHVTKTKICCNGQRKWSAAFGAKFWRKTKDELSS